MTQTILIAGLGTMGTHYTRNLFEMREELNLSNIIGADIDFETCRRIKDEFPELLVYHIAPDSGYIRGAYDDNIGVVRNFSEIVEMEQPEGFIGATQTDSHVDVLSEALSIPKVEPYIRSVLQEKPFGLFDEGGAQRLAIEQKINKESLTFNLDSILMFSGVWDAFDDVLNDMKSKGYVHSNTTCHYGKNRLNDNRPAHEGIFGTEGTHAIDIARRQGHAINAIDHVHMAVIKEGFVNAVSPDIPYYCMADLTDEFGKAVGIEMALNYDRQIRRVSHHYKNINDPRDMMMITLDFDTTNDAGNKVDRMIVKDREGNVCVHFEVPANQKMANALRATFGPDASSVYGVDSVNGLRRIMSDIRDEANYARCDVNIIEIG